MKGIDRYLRCCVCIRFSICLVVFRAVISQTLNIEVLVIDVSEVVYDRCAPSAAKSQSKRQSAFQRTCQPAKKTVPIRIAYAAKSQGGHGPGALGPGDAASAIQSWRPRAAAAAAAAAGLGCHRSE